MSMRFEIWMKEDTNMQSNALNLLFFMIRNT